MCVSSFRLESNHTLRFLVTVTGAILESPTDHLLMLTLPSCWRDPTNMNSVLSPLSIKLLLLLLLLSHIISSLLIFSGVRLHFLSKMHIGYLSYRLLMFMIYFSYHPLHYYGTMQDKSCKYCCLHYCLLICMWCNGM